MKTFINNINEPHQKYTFKLSDEFLKNYKGKQPKWGPLGYVTAKRTYCRNIIKENRTEDWWEVLKRVVEGEFTIQKKHCLENGLFWDENKAKKSAIETYKLMWDFKFLPPGRGLWMMGTDYVKYKGGMALNNCAFTSTKNINNDPAESFTWTMDALMQGVGVGFDTKGADKLQIVKPNKNKMTFKIPDNREGWVYALKLLINNYTFLYNYNYNFDYSLIRKAGEPIHGFGGTASGPAPLKEMLKSIKILLENRIDNYLTSVDIVDIFNYIAKCVVAGNVRRSAQIAIGQPYDNEFIECKQNKEALNDHRWASNNSIFGTPGMDYEKIANMIAVNGEPGIIYLENMRKYGRMGRKPDWLDKKVDGVNPCGEMSLEDREMCTLVEIFPSLHENYEDFQHTLKYAYTYGKTVTLLKTNYPKTNNVMQKNKRIGMSQTGIIDAFTKHGRKTILNWSDKGYKYLKAIDKKYSNDWLCVQPSLKLTTVKPSGTVSLLPGVSPGIHYPHSEYYIRRIRFAKNNKLLPILKEGGYNVYGDPYAKIDNDYRTYCVDFPVHEKNFDRAKEDVSMWEQVANAIDYQKYWADNQVSITVTFNKKEAKDIKYVLQTSEDKLKGLAMLPLLDHKYEAAPYETITKDEYNSMVENLNPINLDNITYNLINGKSIAKGVSGCKTDTCEIKYEIASIGK